MQNSDILDNLKAILGTIGLFIAVGFGGYEYLAQNTVTDPTSKPSCIVGASDMVSIVNKDRIANNRSPVIESSSLDKIAKHLSDSDNQSNAMTVASGNLSAAADAESYISSSLTYQIYPSTDSTVNGYIFKEMILTNSYKDALRDPTSRQIGIYTNCSINTRTITVHATSASQSSINNQQFKVNSLTYLVYDN